MCCTLFVARGDPPGLLQAINQPLNPIALAVNGAINASAPPLIGLAWNRHADATALQGVPDALAPVPFIPHHALGTQFWSSARGACHGTLFHQALKHHRFVPLARRHAKRQRFAPTCGPQMDVGGEPTPAPPQCFSFWVPFVAPAAC